MTTPKDTQGDPHKEINEFHSREETAEIYRVALFYAIKELAGIYEGGYETSIQVRDRLLKKSRHHIATRPEGE